MSEKDGVYILGCNGFFKIGVTNKLDTRVKTLQTGNPFRIIKIGFLTSKSNYSIEKKIHNEYASNRKEGEWFIFSKEELLKIIEKYKFELFADIDNHITFYSGTCCRSIVKNMNKSYKFDYDELNKEHIRLKKKNSHLINLKIPKQVEEKFNINLESEVLILELEKIKSEKESLLILVDIQNNGYNSMEKMYNFYQEQSSTYFDFFLKESERTSILLEKIDQQKAYINSIESKKYTHKNLWSIFNNWISNFIRY